MVAALSAQLERAIRAQIPRIAEHLERSARQLEAELRDLGGAAPSDRGGMLHALLHACDAFDRSYAALLEGGKGGGERVRAVFDSQLAGSIRALPFAAAFALPAVKRTIESADGYQPHLIAPEAGIRRLIGALPPPTARPPARSPTPVPRRDGGE